jgi:hypothetical protein
MPIGIGAAMLIGAAASGGAAVGAAKIQSNAANKAAKTQQAATNQALAVQQQANQPYMDLGRQAAARLSGPALGQPYTQQFGGPNGSNGYQPFAQGRPMQGPQMTLGGLGQPQGAQMPPQPMGAPQGPQGGMVRLQAPDGSMSMVPEAMAQAFIQRGARRVG